MAESLNRSELESLLTALNPAQKPAAEPDQEGESPMLPPVSGSQLVRKVVRFFEGIRKNASSIAEQCVLQPARIKRYMPDRIPFAALRERLQSETITLLAESEQSGGDLLFLFDRDLVFEFVSEMLGQSHHERIDRAELSSLELRILSRWLRESLVGLFPPSQWKLVAVDVVSSPKNLNHYAEQSPWWCEQWELILSGTRGRLHVAGQWEFFTSLASPQATEIASSEESGRVPESRSPDFRQEEVVAVWSEIQGEPRKLAVGDVLSPSEKGPENGTDVTLCSGDRHVARGRVGESGGRKAVEITEILLESREEKSQTS